MLKALLLFALFITGYSCTEYDETNCEIYEALDKGDAFPQLEETFNSGLQDFNVELAGKDIVFLPADKKKALSFKTEIGKLTLIEFTLSYYESGLDWTVRLDTDDEGPNQLYVSSDTFSFPEEVELQEHAEAHAINLEPLTKEDVESLRAQPDKKNKSIQLDVQWIVDLLNNERKPLFFGNLSVGRLYACPPMVMNGDVLKQLSLLREEMENP